MTLQRLAVKTQLAEEYVQSLRLYNLLRHEASGVLAQVQEAVYSRLQLAENDEAAEIFRLTCLE